MAAPGLAAPTRLHFHSLQPLWTTPLWLQSQASQAPWPLLPLDGAGGRQAHHHYSERYGSPGVPETNPTVPASTTEIARLDSSRSAVGSLESAPGLAAVARLDPITPPKDGRNFFSGIHVVV